MRGDLSTVMHNPYDGLALGLLFAAGVAGVALLLPIAAPRFPSVGLGLLGGTLGTLSVLFVSVPDRCPTVWRGLVGFAVGEAICGIGGLLAFWREEPEVSPKLAASLAAACLLGGVTAWESPRQCLVSRHSSALSRDMVPTSGERGGRCLLLSWWSRRSGSKGARRLKCPATTGSLPGGL